MNSRNPAWQPLDPGTGSLPGEIESALDDGGSQSACIVILVDSEIDRDWAAQASVAVAKRWAASGHRVILADGCLDVPVLHKAVGVENGEGVSDMVLYGASAQRFAGRIEDRLMLASAGTPVVEVAPVLEHVRWDMMISGCREVGATLVCHVSASTPGAQAMTKRAEGVLVFASPSKDVDALLGNAPGPLIAILGPENGYGPPAEEDGAVAVETPPVAVEAAPDPVEMTPAEPEVVPETSEVALEEPEPVEAPEAVEAPQPVEPMPEGIEPVAGPPEGAEEAAEPDEAAMGTADVETLAALTVDDLPELPETVDDEAEASDAFSISTLEGAQYQEDSPTVAPDVPDVDSGAGLEDLAAQSLGVDETEDVAAVQDVTVDEALAALQEDVAGERVAVDRDAAGQDVAGQDPSQVYEDIVGEGVASGTDTGGAVDFTLDEDPGVGLEGLETGSGAGLGNALDLDFGEVDLGVADPAESEVAAPPSLEEPPAFSDAIGKMVVEESREVAEPVKAAPARRRKYRGLARLERERKRNVVVRQFMTALLTIVIAGGGGLAAAYYGLVNVPGITPPERVRSYAPAPVVLPGPIPQSSIMTHVLFIDAWTTIETPISTADALRTRLPDLLFFVTPVELDGIPQFALYVGPAYSAVEANALKEPISVVLDRLNPADWTVRDAPYAFYFGEYEVPENAQRRVEALAEASIPAYVLRVDYPDGTSGVRVYGGAFTDEFEAAQMGQMISRADIGGMVLTFRHGTIPE